MKNSKLILSFAIVSLVVLSSCKRKSTTAPSIKQLAWSLQEDEPRPKKRLLILSSSGGGGHTAAAHAIREYLKDGYDIEIVNVFEEVLHPLDPLHSITGGSYNGEDLYNFFLKNNARWFANNMVALGKVTMNWQSRQIQPMLEEFFAHNKPDAIISVIPVLNGSILAVAEKMDIPFAVIALDRDMASIGFLNGIWQPTYKKFIFGVPFKDQELKKTVTRKTGIAVEQIRAVGVPVRASFLEKKDIPALRHEFNVPEDKPVVMVLMGSVGSGATIRYARALARMKQPVHLFLCLGKNEQLRERIEKEITFPAHISVSIIGFTNRIADYMAVSNLLITKSGAASVFEALVSQVPILFDRTREVLAWEYKSITFVKEHGFGDEICMIRRAPKIVDAYLKDSSKELAIRENIAQYELPDVKQNVITLVEDLMAMHDAPAQAPTFVFAANFL